MISIQSDTHINRKQTGYIPREHTTNILRHPLSSSHHILLSLFLHSSVLIHLLSLLEPHSWSTSLLFLCIQSRALGVAWYQAVHHESHWPSKYSAHCQELYQVTSSLCDASSSKILALRELQSSHCSPATNRGRAFLFPLKDPGFCKIFQYKM